MIRPGSIIITRENSPNSNEIIIFQPTNIICFSSPEEAGRHCKFLIWKSLNMVNKKIYELHFMNLDDVLSLQEKEQFIKGYCSETPS